MAEEDFIFACPVCRGGLVSEQEAVLKCPACEVSYPRIGGVWRMLPADRAVAYGKFAQEYETIRRAEGRGSMDPAYYRALPFADLSGLRSGEWVIRGRSFQALLDLVIVPLERQEARKLHILDLGAGNGWLSNRLAQRGHQIAAVDLLTNTFDGLGAHRQYETRFLPMQAEFDRLPLGDGQVDLAIYNASFHYSTNYITTLGEALRVLSMDGQVVVLDTPVYHQPKSGAQMVRERQAQFLRQYGFPSDALPSKNFLTDEQVRKLGDVLDLHWREVAPGYGLRWALRPWMARLRRQREPARFVILIGERKGYRKSA